MTRLDKLLEEIRGELGPQGSHFKDGPSGDEDQSCDGNDAWSRLEALEARLYASYNIEKYEEEESTGLDTYLDWNLLDRELLKLGFPPLLQPLKTADSNDDDGLMPLPEDAFNAILGALKEIQSLRRVIEVSNRQRAEINRREDRVTRQHASDMKQKGAQITRLEKLVDELKLDLSESQAKSDKFEKSARKNAEDKAHCQVLVDNLSKQLKIKETEHATLKQQIQDLQSKDIRRHLQAKTSIETIRHALASQRVGLKATDSKLGGGGMVPLAWSSPPFPQVASLNALQIAKIFDTKLQAVEEEANAARAEAGLLLHSLKSKQRATIQDSDEWNAHNDNSLLLELPNTATAIIKNASHEIAAAQGESARLREELHAAVTELRLRPTCDTVDELTRENKLLSRRIQRLERQLKTGRC